MSLPQPFSNSITGIMDAISATHAWVAVQEVFDDRPTLLAILPDGSACGWSSARKASELSDEEVAFALGHGKAYPLGSKALADSLSAAQAPSAFVGWCQGGAHPRALNDALAARGAVELRGHTRSSMPHKGIVWSSVSVDGRDILVDTPLRDKLASDGTLRSAFAAFAKKTMCAAIQLRRDGSEFMALPISVATHGVAVFPIELDFGPHGKVPAGTELDAMPIGEMLFVAHPTADACGYTHAQGVFTVARASCLSMLGDGTLIP